MAEIIDLTDLKFHQDDDYGFALFEEIAPRFHEGHDPVMVCFSLWITLTHCLFEFGHFTDKELASNVKSHYKIHKKS